MIEKAFILGIVSLAVVGGASLIGLSVTELYFEVKGLLP